MKFEDLQKAMIDAMKAHEADRKETISLLVAAVKKVAIDAGQRDNITEEMVDSVLLKELKSVKEQIDTCPADRAELLESYKNRLAVMEEFAPKMLSAEEVEAMSAEELAASTETVISVSDSSMAALEEMNGTLTEIKKISEEIGKTPVQVNEAAGFVVNRILIPMINEAAFIKMEGVSDIAGIDAAMKLGANHPMGPLELGDFIGLDICLAIMDVLYNETGDSKYRACPLIRKMVRGGNLGVKSGKGFYIYNADRTKTAIDAQ